MELDELQDRWRMLDQKLDRVLDQQTSLMQNLQLKETQRRVRRLLIWPVIEVLYCIGVLMGAGWFIYNYWPEPSLVVPAIVVHIAAILQLRSMILQQILAQSIVWDGPIANIQAILTQWRLMRIRHFKWGLLLSPLIAFCCMIMTVQWLFGHLTGTSENFIAKFDPAWILVNYLFAVLFIPVGYWLTEVMQKRWQGTSFWQRCLDDICGSTLTRTKSELDRWTELAKSD